MRGAGPALAACLLALTACGGAAATSTTALPTRTPAPTSVATTAATPVPVHRVDIVAAGFGSYLETTVPVVVVHNASATENAASVQVQVTLQGPATGTTTATLLAPSIAAGSDAVITARLAGSHRGDTVTASVSVGTWTSPAAVAVVAAAGTPTCGGCARGGSGDVTVHVAAGAVPGTLVVAAACRDGRGTLVGGGSAVRQGGSTFDLVVPVILSAAAATCVASALPGGF